MALREPDFDTAAIIDLTQANVPPVAGTAAWDTEMAYLREDRAADGTAPSQPARSDLSDIVDSATLEG